MKFLNHMTAQAAPASETGLSRRLFLKATGGATAGLVVGFALPKSAAAAAGDGAFNPFVKIAPDGAVTVIVKHLDKGQGTASALATLVADELDADWSKVGIEFAPSNPKLYNNLHWGEAQGTGGSTAIANSFMQYRQAGAAAKAMLVAAAAKAWSVPDGEISVADGVLSHPSGKSSGFGDLAARASAEMAPKEPALKSPDQFKLIGNPAHRRLDSASMTRGEKTYTQDIQLPGMLVAVIARPPKFGATVKSVDATQARAVRGVDDVVTVPQGVAVLATDTWAALQGRAALVVEWDFAKAETRSSEDLFAEYRDLAEQPGLVAHDDGGAAETALANAATVVEATYEFPYLAHAPMEPINAVADLKPGQSLDVWSGSQIQTVDHGTAATIAQLPMEKVRIHTLFAGGSFGRRATPTADMVNEAVNIAVAIGGRAPVKLVWSREDDIRGGFYRPMYVHKVKAGLDAEGNITGWHHRIVGQSIAAGTPFEGFLIHEGVDHTSVEGATVIPYAMGPRRLELTTTSVGVPVLWWRSVGSTHTAYVVETMMDRLAKAAGQDPVEFRLKRMAGYPREAAVLKLAAEKAGWGKEMPAGVHRGVAVHKSFGSYVAQVADVRVADDGTMKVEKVVCAIDCGIAATPDQVAAQMEGGIGYGLGAVLRNRVTLDAGEVVQSQFFDYEPLRISDMPAVETHIVPSTEAPTGAGEPGTPPVGPAVANALMWGTGREINTLPFADHGVV